MMNIKRRYLITAIFCIQICTSSGFLIQNATSTQFPTNNEEEINPSSTERTIVELIAQRTEDIKKIVADQNQQQTSTIEYPVLTKSEPDYSEEAKKQIEKLSIEELKVKCQHFSKLFQVNKTSAAKLTDPNTNILNRSNHKPYSYQPRPVYIQPKPTYKPKYVTTQKPSGFYITQGSYNTIKPTHAHKTPVKYIRLEPVILQKTILSDGRTVYYWHRSLPTAVEVASDVTQSSQVPTSTDQPYPSHNNYYGPPPMYSSYNSVPYSYNNLPYRYPSWPPNPYAAAYQNYNTSTTTTTTEDSSVREQKSTEATTESSTTSTTEPTSYGYGFGSFLPFYGYHRQEGTTTTTEATTTTTATTTEKTRKDDLLYAQQLKFIIPVPYEDLNGGTIPARNPWEFDQYAYYPKGLQPNAMNVQVPYNPTFHMIRAVAIPSSKVSDEIIP